MCVSVREKDSVPLVFLSKPVNGVSLRSRSSGRASAKEDLYAPTATCIDINKTLTLVNHAPLDTAENDEIIGIR